jgi:hypothetical protein
MFAQTTQLQASSLGIAPAAILVLVAILTALGIIANVAV